MHFPCLGICNQRIEDTNFEPVGSTQGLGIQNLAFGIWAFGIWHLAFGIRIRLQLRLRIRIRIGVCNIFDNNFHNENARWVATAVASPWKHLELNVVRLLSSCDDDVVNKGVVSTTVEVDAVVASVSNRVVFHHHTTHLGMRNHKKMGICFVLVVCDLRI